MARSSHLKFKFKKTNRNSALIERPEIILWCTKYLKEMERYRNENRNIYYLDETWVNAGKYLLSLITDHILVDMTHHVP